jgi:hypothetical protein
MSYYTNALFAYFTLFHILQRCAKSVFGETLGNTKSKNAILSVFVWQYAQISPLEKLL